MSNVLDADMSLDVTGLVSFVSVETVDTAPDIVDIGGFAVSTAGGSLYFDFLDSKWITHILSDGRLRVSSRLIGFDEEFYNENNQNLPFPGWSEVTSHPIEDVYCQVGHVRINNLITNVNMVLEDLVIVTRDKSDMEVRFPFSRLQVNTYNEVLSSMLNYNWTPKKEEEI